MKDFSVKVEIELLGKLLLRETRVADARRDMEMCRLLALKTAYMMDTVGNKVARAEIAMIKVAAPRMALKIIDDAIQAYGGMGVTNDTILAYFYAGIRTLSMAMDRVKSTNASLEMSLNTRLH